MAERVRIILADDHPIYREGLVETLKGWPEIDVVAVCADGAEALEAIREHAPAVAVLDLRMPGLGGRDVLEALAQDHGSDTATLMISAEFDSENVYAALGAGAGGFISKDRSGREICEAVLAVARGETVLDEKSQAAVAQGVRRRSAVDRRLLSRREQEMIRLTSEGMSAREIGEVVHLSPTTVKTHLQRAYEKLGVGDRAAAVAEAMRRGMLD